MQPNGKVAVKQGTKINPAIAKKYLMMDLKTYYKKMMNLLESLLLMT